MDEKFKEWIIAQSLDPETLSDKAVASLTKHYQADMKAAEEARAALKTPPKTPAPIQGAKFDIDQLRGLYAAHETAVQKEIFSYEGKIDPPELALIRNKHLSAALDIKSEAIEHEWNPLQFEVATVKAMSAMQKELLIAERPKPVPPKSSMQDANHTVLQAAFARTCGLTEPEKHYKPEILEAADKYKGIGLHELLLLCARQNGWEGRNTLNNSNAKEIVKAAFSTHTITTMLTQAGNKLLLDGFNIVPQTWRTVGAAASVRDFKAVTAFRLTADLEYEELPPSGEIKHGTLGQESYSMQAKTYARMAALTRTDIINDDLQAFNDLRTRLGMGAAIAMQKVFWLLWINNSTFFTTTRGNKVESAALGDAGLASAIAAFRKMTGPDGNLLNLEPEILLVPPSLEATARKFYASQEIRDTTANTRLAVANIYYNRFRPVVIPELENSSYTGYSATTWYLLSNPAILATALMCFLDGQQAPTIESADTDFNTLGIQFRGYHDFGAAFAEYRAGVQATA